MLKKLLTIFLCHFILILSSALWADVLVTNIDEEGTSSTFKISNEWAKIVTQTEPDQYMMVNMKKNNFYMIDRENKMVIDMGDMSAMTAMMPKSNNDQNIPKYEIKKVGSGPKVAGYNTTHYQLKIKNNVCSEHFVSKELMKKSEIEAFSESMKKQANAASGMMFSASPCEIAEEDFDKKVFEYGVPLLSKNANGNVTFEITKIDTKASFPKNEFQFPKEFKVVTQAELIQQEMQNMANENNMQNAPAMAFDLPDMEGLGSNSMSEEDLQNIQEQMQEQLQQLQQMMQQQKSE